MAPELPLREAAGLGLLHGPAELLPISSSGHIELIPWLLRWRYPSLDPELRKAFEVALHAGTAAALVIGLREEVALAVRELDRNGAVRALVTLAPAAVAGTLLEGPIERRLGGAGSIAVGLLAGSAWMAWADRAPRARGWQAEDMADAAAIGLAQACALMPGVSRNGATLSAARRRGFCRPDANRLSRHAALPVITGATALKSLRLHRRGLPAELRAPFVLGAAAAFGSTLASVRLIGQVERDRSLLPFAAYRSGLAALALWRLRAGAHAEA